MGTVLDARGQMMNARSECHPSEAHTTAEEAVIR